MVRLNSVWKLYLFYTSVLVVGMTLGGFVLQVQLKRTLTRHLTGHVVTLARVMEHGLPDTQDSALLDAWCKDQKKVAGLRVTVIRQDGRVMGESDRDAIDIDNHLEREEVHEAIRKGMGTAVRRSKTLGIDMLYVALSSEGKGRILRVAMPTAEVKDIRNQVMVLIVLALYLAPALAIVISYFFVRYMRPPP